MPTVMERLDQWVATRGNGRYADPKQHDEITPIQQVRAEIAELVGMIEGAGISGHALEIGLGKYGGSHILFAMLFGKVVTIDANEQEVKEFLDREKATLDQRSSIIIGDSHDAWTSAQAIARAVPVSFLHIDGDHTFEGVMTDYRTYAPNVRKGGIIAIHDLMLSGVDRFCYELEFGAVDGKKHRLKKIVHSTHVGYAVECIE